MSLPLFTMGNIIVFADSANFVSSVFIVFHVRGTQEMLATWD